MDCPDIALKSLRDGVCTTSGPGSKAEWYEIEITADGGANWNKIEGPGGLMIGKIRNTTHTVYGLDHTTEYGFRIRAWNGAGESDPGSSLYVATNAVPGRPDP
eukprot:SAG31_NODE_14485_length_804_cov_0.734752_2_plen_102_part_01